MVDINSAPENHGRKSFMLQLAKMLLPCIICAITIMRRYGPLQCARSCSVEVQLVVMHLICDYEKT